MKEEKTIEEFNKKIWYRILKVFYFVLIITSIIISFYFIYQNKKPIKKEVYQDTLIICDNGSKYSLKEMNCLREEQTSLLNRVCTEGIKCTNNNKPLSLQERINKKMAIRNEGDGLIFFSLDDQYKIIQENSMIKLIMFFVLSFFVILFSAEIVRRIFYYIAFGKFFLSNINKKNAKENYTITKSNMQNSISSTNPIITNQNTKQEKGTLVRKMRKIAIILYIISAVFGIAMIIIIAIKTGVIPTDLSQSSFGYLTIWFAVNFFTGNKEKLDKRVYWFKNKWGWFILIITILLPFMFLGFINAIGLL